MNLFREASVFFPPQCVIYITMQEKELLSSKVVRLEEGVSELTMKLKPALSDRNRLLKVQRRHLGTKKVEEW